MFFFYVTAKLYSLNESKSAGFSAVNQSFHCQSINQQNFPSLALHPIKDFNFRPLVSARRKFYFTCKQLKMLGKCEACGGACGNSSKDCGYGCGGSKDNCCKLKH